MSIATKLGRVLTYFKGLLTIKILMLWSHGLAMSRYKRKLLNLYYTVLMSTKLRRIISYLNRFRPIESYTLWSRGLSKSHAKLNDYIFTITLPIATKLGRLVTNLEVVLEIKSHNPLITWSDKITWQTIISSSSLPQCSSSLPLWPPKLGG